MRTTEDDERTSYQPPRRGLAPHGRQTRAPQSREHALLMQYMAHVEKARQYEAQALAQLRAGLAAVGGGAESLQRGSVISPAADPYAPARRRSPRRTGPSIGRYGAVVAFVVALVLLGWVALRGGAEQPAGTAAAGKHAGHDMSQMGGGSAEPVQMAPAGEIPVELGEFFVKAKYNKVRAGSVTFQLENSGQGEHEFMVASLDELPQDEVEQMSGAEVHEKVLGAEHGITPGYSDTELTVDLEPGKYLLFCNLPGHYAQGQHTVLRVA